MIDSALTLLAVVTAVPCAVLLLQCLASLWPLRASTDRAPPAPRPRTAILIPSHNEKLSIGATVASLRPDMGDQDRLIVIADNCDDDTAALARQAGAEAIERRDPDHRGKGYAIGFGLEHLDADPPAVVVLADADCRISPGGLERLARLAVASGRPVQAEYLLGAPKKMTSIGAVSALAVLVRNRVRPRGLGRLGMPCALTGSGMAFPFRVLRDAPATDGNLVEDLVMGIELALQGHPPLPCPDVQVSSELPESHAAAMKQRRRWEHGQLATLTKFGPRLLGAGIVRMNVGLLALGLDLVVPPLALLVMGSVGLLAVAGLGAALGLTSWTPAFVAGGGMAMVVLAVAVAWAKYGRQTVPLRYLLAIPFYVAWKIPLYARLIFKGKQRTWERTARKGESEP